MFKTLVDTQTLAAHLDDPRWVVLDCRFSLRDPDAGQRAYRVGHIPGAHYAHLNEDLAGPLTSASGRHPLPAPKLLAEKLGKWGIDKTKQVVVYDDSLGAIAARVWWLLRWLGHDAVAVLDGDFHRWQREGRPMSTETPTVVPTQFHPTINNELWVDTAAVEGMVERGEGVILDARSEERYRGEVEPFDPVAGHIPGALNSPFEDNLEEGGHFKKAAQLRGHYKNVLGDKVPTEIVHMCGSGVTACHNLLAMEHAGLTGAKLYAGSWSEWIRDLKRPIEK